MLSGRTLHSRPSRFNLSQVLQLSSVEFDVGSIKDHSMYTVGWDVSQNSHQSVGVGVASHLSAATACGTRPDETIMNSLSGNSVKSSQKNFVHTSTMKCFRTSLNF